MNVMNIYLDMSGVLLVNGTHAANYADEFLQAILEKYPDSTYWITARSRNDETHAKKVLVSCLKPETIQLIDKVKQAEWSELKTDAINFDEDFLWFDDDIWPDELKVLEEHEAAQQFILIKLEKDPDMLKKLTEVIKSNA